MRTSEFLQLPGIPEATSFKEADSGQFFYRVECADTLPDKVQANTCYICDDAKLASLLLRKRPSVLFLCGEAAGIKDAKRFNGTRADFSPDLSATELYRAAAPYVYKEQQEYSDKLQRMLDTLELSDGMQELTDRAFAALLNPLFVIDGTSHFIAYAFDETSYEEDDAFGRFISSNIPYRRVSEVGDKFYRRNRLNLLLPQTRDIIEQYDESLGCISLHRGLYLQDICYGRIWMPCIQHAPTEMDHRIFEQFALLAEQHIAKHRFQNDDHQEYSSLLLADLLSAPYVDPVILQTSVNTFHIDPTDCFYVVVTESLHQKDTTTVALLRSQFRQSFPTHPATVLENRIISLFCLNSVDEIRKYQVALEDYAAHTRLHIGVSNAWFRLEGIQAALQKARHSVQLGIHMTPDQSVHFYDDYAIYDLLFEYQKHNRLSSLVTPKMRKVIDSDNDRGTEYFKTLKAYFKYQGNKEKICKALHIHKNTLLYRMNRLKEYYELNFDDGDETIKYQLAIHIVETLKHVNRLDDAIRASMQTEGR